MLNLDCLRCTVIWITRTYTFSKQISRKLCRRRFGNRLGRFCSRRLVRRTHVKCHAPVATTFKYHLRTLKRRIACQQLTIRSWYAIGRNRTWHSKQPIFSSPTEPPHQHLPLAHFTMFHPLCQWWSHLYQQQPRSGKAIDGSYFRGLLEISRKNPNPWRTSHASYNPPSKLILR